MVYEIYADSLFLINFVMNLYLLMLVNRKLMCTATRMRMVLGAGIGAAVYVLSFCFRLPVWLKWPAGLLTAAGSMLVFSFRPGTFRTFLKQFVQLCRYSFLMGGVILAFRSTVPVVSGHMPQIGAVLGMGALCSLTVGYGLEKAALRRQDPMRSVRLRNGNITVCRSALLDSGNGLREPISGKPVCIIDTEIFRALWGVEEPPFRAIPYHSIGKKNGILRGYRLPVLEVEMEGEWSSYPDIYVAVSAECAVGMILSPYLFEENAHIPRKRIRKECERNDL